MVFMVFRTIFSMLSCALLGAAATHCTTSDKGYEAKDFLPRGLAGKVKNKEWAYKYAYVDPTIDTPEDDDYVFVFLTEKPAEACPKSDESAKDYRVVMVAAPKKPTKTPVKLKRGGSRTLQFHTLKNREPFVVSALTGKIKITSSSENEVKGQLMAQLNPANFVNGTFKAKVCDLSEMKKEDLWQKD